MNFKKNEIFGHREDGGQREAEYDGYGSPNQVLAVWGSPGSGEAGKIPGREEEKCDPPALRHDRPHAALHLSAWRTGMRAFPGQCSGCGAGVGIPGEA